MIVDISKKPDIGRYARASAEIDASSCNTDVAVKAAVNASRYLPFLHPLPLTAYAYCAGKLYVEGGTEWQTGVEMDVLFGALTGSVASGASQIKNLAVELKVKGTAARVPTVGELRTSPLDRQGDLVARAYGELEVKNSDLVKGPVEKGHPIYSAQTVAALNVKRLCELIDSPCPTVQHFKIDLEVGDKVTSRVYIKSRDYSPAPEALFAVGVAFLTIWDMIKKWEKDEEGQYPHTKVRVIVLE